MIPDSHSNDLVAANDCFMESNDLVEALRRFRIQAGQLRTVGSNDCCLARSVLGVYFAFVESTLPGMCTFR